jgi:hypothetical protein
MLINSVDKPEETKDWVDGINKGIEKAKAASGYLFTPNSLQFFISIQPFHHAKHIYLNPFAF